jgi:hypothetical protein
MVFSKHLLISKTQNIARLKGDSFIYHLTRSNSKITRCGIPNCRKLTYTEAHTSDGIALTCDNCVHPYK